MSILQELCNIDLAARARWHPMICTPMQPAQHTTLLSTSTAKHSLSRRALLQTASRLAGLAAVQLHPANAAASSSERTTRRLQDAYDGFAGAQSLQHHALLQQLLALHCDMQLSAYWKGLPKKNQCMQGHTTAWMAA